MLSGFGLIMVVLSGRSEMTPYQLLVGVEVVHVVVVEV